MKLRQGVTGLGLLALVLAVQLGAYAITVEVNGTPLPASPPAVQQQGRVLLPLRVVFESLGAQVHWVAETQTVTAQRGDRTVQMTINSPTAYVNEQAVTLDVPPQLIGGSTYVPVRFPAEALGADVRWDQTAQTVLITQQAAPSPPVAAPAPPPAPAPQPTQTGQPPLTVDFTPTTPRAPGDSLQVIARGPAGGQASADLGTLLTAVPLPEVEEGIYAAELTIPPVTGTQTVPLTVHLRTADGQVIDATAPGGVVVEGGS